MKILAGRYNYFFLLILVFLVAEIIVNPIGDFPLNDDWSYAKAVYYSMTDHYTIGHFGAMTLFTHVAWGMLFVKIFGFSFNVLRLSTFISVLIGLFFMDKLIFKITGNKLSGFLAGLVLLFNPLFFNLSNTFMTDVNFNTLLILCCYFAFCFFETGKFLNVVIFSILAALMVLLRQFGIIVPVCFMIACLFRKEKKLLSFSVSVLVALFVYFCLYTYEKYLKGILPEGSSYKFSGGVHVSDPEFWKMFSYNFGERYKILLVQLGVYLAPFAAFYLIPLLRSFKTYSSVVIVLLSVYVVHLAFKDVRFPFQNIFENMWLGPETFYQSLSGAKGHLYSETFISVMKIVKYVFMSVTFSTLSLYIFSLFRQNKPERLFRSDPVLVFLVVFMLAYVFMIFITESYFDRYYIPLICVGLVLMAFINKKQVGDYKLVLILLLPLCYVSVFGTKDYLTWNRVRWQAYAFLKETKGATAEKVNGGFELNCWNDRQQTWWGNYLSVDNFDYLIQFDPEPGFEVLKEYEFQRYFPFRKDKLFIFKNSTK
ncbi:MAG: glycosyltransferase family 39 protein [Chitinophagaceae bacterium]|nr:glycosyltransferase family 39 protein [Chitinophagaceae bacterium]